MLYYQNLLFIKKKKQTNNTKRTTPNKQRPNKSSNKDDNETFGDNSSNIIAEYPGKHNLDNKGINTVGLTKSELFELELKQARKSYSKKPQNKQTTSTPTKEIPIQQQKKIDESTRQERDVIPPTSLFEIPNVSPKEDNLLPFNSGSPLTRILSNPPSNKNTDNFNLNPTKDTSNYNIPSYNETSSSIPIPQSPQSSDSILSPSPNSSLLSPNSSILSPSSPGSSFFEGLRGKIPNTPPNTNGFSSNSMSRQNGTFHQQQNQPLLSVKEIEEANMLGSKLLGMFENTMNPTHNMNPNPNMNPNIHQHQNRMFNSLQQNRNFQPFPNPEQQRMNIQSQNRQTPTPQQMNNSFSFQNSRNMNPTNQQLYQMQQMNRPMGMYQNNNTSNNNIPQNYNANIRSINPQSIFNQQQRNYNNTQQQYFNRPTQNNINENIEIVSVRNIEKRN